jgi:signal transduction histidine kinase
MWLGRGGAMNLLSGASFQRASLRRGFFALLALILLFAANNVVAARDQTIDKPFHRGRSFAQDAPGQICAIYQASDGFLWLASAQPLYRFDGIHFKAFIPDGGRSVYVIACIIILWLVHVLWLRRASVLTRRTLEAKHAERERITRNLHDTLLQGLQGIVLQFQAALDELNNESKAKKSLEDALDAAERVVVEARIGVLDLRSNEEGDLLDKLRLVTSELSKGCSMRFSIVTEGVVRCLRHHVQGEIVLIAKEAIFNAFQHSRGTLLEIELAYQCEGLRVRVRDNGDGMQEHIVTFGRPGHWGLEGMRERASHLSSTLRIWSREGAGTEVELFVSGKQAYLHSSERSLIRRFISRFRS